MRLTTRGTAFLLAPLGLLAPVMVIAAQTRSQPVEDSPVAVRFSEGTLHGFLLLHSEAGALLAHGDLRQTGRGDTVLSQMTFRFTDGSLLDEEVTYAQHRVFSMRTYSLIQRGPAFDEDTEIRLERSGKYRVKTKAHKDGKEDVHEGTLDLPGDTYNGLVLTLLKNLPKGTTTKIHVVAFTPKPRIVSLEIESEGEHRILIGDVPLTAIHYVLKPRLGTVTTLFAKALGRMPPDNHAWVLKDEVPAFVRFVGPLYPAGPIWRIELTAPRWPD